MSFSLEKYKYYIVGKKIIAVSTYAGKVVRGVAICADNDKFSAVAGKEIAAARCNVKVCRKRKNRAQQKYHEAYDNFIKARRELDTMSQYLTDSSKALSEAEIELTEIENKY
jgi:hypothetical protein